MSEFIQQIFNGVTLGSVFALYALGFSLVLSNLKVFNLAHTAVFTWGAIFAWQLVSQWNLPLVVAILLASVLAGLLNVACYLLLVLHLENRPNKEMAGFISTLGGMIVLSELAMLFLDRRTVRLPVEAFPIEIWSLGPIQISSIQVFTLAIVLVIYVVLRWLVGSTQLGREMRTASFDRELARLLGINATRVSVLVFFISGAIAGIGALMVSISFNTINADLGSSYMVTAFAVMVIGGLGNMTGIFSAALIVGVISSLTTGYLSSSFRDVIIFGVLLAFLAFRPTGLFKGSDIQERV